MQNVCVGKAQENTAEISRSTVGVKPQRAMAADLSNTKKRRKAFACLPKINYLCIAMYKQLTSAQRYTISVLLQKKMTQSFIAAAIGVSASTVSRDLKRNSNGKGVYSSHVATLKARRRKSRNPGNRSIVAGVRNRVFELIRSEQWSPEEVSGWLGKEEGMKVSKSTIYNWIASCSPHHKDNIRRHLRHGGRKGKASRKSGAARYLTESP